VIPKSSRPFESIESAHEFIALLETSLGEAKLDVASLLDDAQEENDPRRVEALRLALFKMEQLSSHMQKSRRILNDLRSIRILLFQERGSRPSV